MVKLSLFHEIYTVYDIPERKPIVSGGFMTPQKPLPGYAIGSNS